MLACGVVAVLPGLAALDRRRVAAADAAADVAAVVGARRDGTSAGAAATAATAATYFVVAGARASPWHGVPQLHAADTGAAGGGRLATMVVEIPVGATAKLEVDTRAPWTPLVQDVAADGSPRHYPTPAPFTYGMLPRTFSHPRVRDAVVDAPGDGDPVDAVDVTGGDGGSGGDGGAVPAVGDVAIVRVLGAFAVLDGGRVDWKIVVAQGGAAAGLTGTCGCRSAACDDADARHCAARCSRWDARSLHVRRPPTSAAPARAVQTSAT